jgi:ABC-type glycerol-3-phosphate transport system permease component
MIIYGYRNRKVEVATGQFVCPKCDTSRTYKHINVIRYFTLFFIQLFPLGKVTSYIECQTCMRAFKPEEIVGTRGNEQFSQDLQIRNAAAAQKAKATRGRAMSVIGTIMMVVGGLALAIWVAFQLFGTANPTEDLGSFFLIACLCPIPVTLAGLGLLIWGVRTRRSATESAGLTGTTPMA